MEGVDHIVVERRVQFVERGGVVISLYEEDMAGIDLADGLGEPHVQRAHGVCLRLSVADFVGRNGFVDQVISDDERIVHVAPGDLGPYGHKLVLVRDRLRPETGLAVAVRHQAELPYSSSGSTLYYAVTSLGLLGAENTDVSNSAVEINNPDLSVSPPVLSLTDEQSDALFDTINAGMVSNEHFPAGSMPFVVDDTHSQLSELLTLPDNNADLSGSVWVAYYGGNDATGVGPEIWIYAEVTDDVLSFTPSGDGPEGAWAYDSIELGWGNYDVRDAADANFPGMDEVRFFPLTITLNDRDLGEREHQITWSLNPSVDNNWWNTPSQWQTVAMVGPMSPTSSEGASELPKVYALAQNYPNPFNPATTIRFQLPKAEQVTLRVFDVLGREVASLLDNTSLAGGEHAVRFDASGLTSGVYLYRLEAGASFVQTKRMMLVK